VLLSDLQAKSPAFHLVSIV